MKQEIHEESCNRFISNIANVIHGRQAIAYKDMKTNNWETNTLSINDIEKEKWNIYY